jgi:kynurenine formamidase
VNTSEIANWLTKNARIIDLSLTIDPSSSYYHFPVKEVYGKNEPILKIETVSSHEDGVFWQKFEMSTQDFTHLDAPKHFFKDGLANHEVPLEQLIGEAVVIDMTNKQPGDLITAQDLEKSGVEVKSGDIVIIRTGWTDQAFGTKKFWSDQIGLSLDAGDWLVEKGIKALVTDFYTDPQPVKACETCGALHKIERAKIRNHHKFLSRGILLIDFVTNLKAIKYNRVLLICLPIKLKGTDGAPARVIAIEPRDEQL